MKIKLQKHIIKGYKKINLNKKDEVLLIEVNHKTAKPDDCQFLANSLHKTLESIKFFIFPDFIKIKDYDKEQAIKYFEDCINKLKEIED